MNIDYKNIVDDYSENSFELIKKYLQEYISCFCIDYSDMERSMFIEKLYEYVLSYEVKNNKKDSAIPELYVKELMSIISKLVMTPKKDEPSCRAYLFLEKAQDIVTRIKKKHSNNLLDDLEDISKIFICIYDEYLRNNKKKIEDIDFNIHSDRFDYIKANLINKKSSIKTNDKESIIYNTILKNKSNEIYKTKRFIVMILTLFFVRLVELECGELMES